MGTRRERPFLNDPLRRLVRKGCAYDFAVKRGWLQPTQQDEALNYGEYARRYETRRKAIQRDWGDVIDRVLVVLEDTRGLESAAAEAGYELRELAVDVIAAALQVEPTREERDGIASIKDELDAVSDAALAALAALDSSTKKGSK